MMLETHGALRDIIERELALTHELGEALAAERDALQTVDPAALDLATARKQDCIESLSTLDTERHHLCAAAGLTPDRNGMDRLLLQVDPHGKLAEKWQALLTRLETCREVNNSNGVIVRLQRRRVTEALGILNGEAANNAVYGDSGEVDETAGNHLHAEI